MPTRHCLFCLFSLHKSLTCTHLKNRNEPPNFTFWRSYNALASTGGKRSSSKLLIYMPICKKWQWYSNFTSLQEFLSHAEQAFKPQLNWFWLYWFYKTSGTVNGWVMVLKHVFEFSHKRYDLIQPLLDYGLTTVTSSKGQNAAENDAMRPRRLDDKKQYNFYLAFSLSLEHVPLEPCAIM